MHDLARRSGQEDSDWLRSADASVYSGLSRLRDRIRISSADDNIVRSLKEHLPTAGMEAELTRNGTRDITEGVAELDDSQFIDFLRQRGVSVSEKCQNLEANTFEPIIAEFKEWITYAVTKQNLPLDLQTALNRLDNVKVIYADPLCGIGRFSPETGVATLGLNDEHDEQTIRRAVRHELTHSLEGWEPTAHNGYKDRILNYRSGLRQHGRDQHMKWISELVTDKVSHLLEDKTVDFKTLTLRELMSPEHAVSHYTSEGPLFFKLLNGPYGQIAFYDVLSAYFENHDPHALRGERSLMLKQLYAKLDAAWGGYDTIAPVIHGADNENWGGPDHEPGKVAYAKAFMRLINLHIECTADNT